MESSPASFQRGRTAWGLKAGVSKDVPVSASKKRLHTGLRLLHHFLVLGRKPGVVRSRLILHTLLWKHALCFPAGGWGGGEFSTLPLSRVEKGRETCQFVFDQTKLEALETRGRHKVVPEIEKIERAHRLDDLDLANQQIEDLHHSFSVVIDRAHAFLLFGQESAHRPHTHTCVGDFTSGSGIWEKSLSKRSISWSICLNHSS